MIISKIQNSNQTSFGAKYVPLSEYKGPILRLTEKEKAEVDVLELKIAKYLKEIAEIENASNKLYRVTPVDRALNSRAITKILSQIKNLRNKIDRIKANRFEIQKQAFKV